MKATNNVCKKNKRMIVVSDLHGRDSILHDIIEREPTASALFYLGDGINGAERIAQYYPDLPFYSVRGNCDGFGFYNEQAEKLITLFGKKILYCHGHTLSVKQGLERIENYALNVGADIVLFGHTHTAYTAYKNGVHYLNPGSPSRPNDFKPSYAVVDIYDRQVICNIIRI